MDATRDGMSHLSAMNPPTRTGERTTLQQSTLPAGTVESDAPPELPETIKRYLSPAEFAKLFRLSLSTVRRRIKDGSLPAIQPGGKRKHWRIDVVQFRSSVNSVEPVNDQHQQSIETKQPTPRSGDGAKPIPGPPARWMTSRSMHLED
ncbi:Helix-turn-helix domain protein [Planctomycetes bacterium Pan216]|uniref:Helix-turn-helix domain protein n=1 Tax=Kolteria novifilia TaxID=2527975 RepID=A0A518B220_9BACT|nr:Helix-turn-helix domain protein [Planctomycetes bacterium Pan216]